MPSSVPPNTGQTSGHRYRCSRAVSRGPALHGPSSASATERDHPAPNYPGDVKDRKGGFSETTTPSQPHLFTEPEKTRRTFPYFFTAVNISVVRFPSFLPWEAASDHSLLFLLFFFFSFSFHWLHLPTATHVTHTL